jgi:hypothetical protein
MKSRMKKLRNQEIKKWSVLLKVPITVYQNDERIAKFLIEEKFQSFPVFAEQLEVEVNGRWFERKIHKAFQVQDRT